MSIKTTQSSLLNPEPITVKGIKLYNPQILRIYTNKNGEAYYFDPIEKKSQGVALGAIYKKRKDNSTDKKWMGKVGEPRGEFRNDSSSVRTRMRKEINLDTILEKLSFDLFQELGRCFFEVPKTHLALLSIQNAFSQTHALAIDWQEIGVHESLRIMSSYLEGYQDLQHAQTLDGGETVGLMKYLKKYQRPPETILTPDQKVVPLEGIMQLLAVGRCLADADLLGGGGGNAGFRWVYDENQNIQFAKVIKIDPGYALNFTHEEGSQDSCVNWAINTLKGLGDPRYHLKDLKDLQTSNGNPETTVSWSALTLEQKDQFLGALLNTSRYLQTGDVINFLFNREGSFYHSKEAQFPIEMASETRDQMTTWIKEQLRIYAEPLRDFLERYPELLLRIRYIDAFGELPLPASEKVVPIRELFSDLTLHQSKGEKEKEPNDFPIPIATKRPIRLNQLFSGQRKKVILTGESGTGKSALCQKIAHDWASGRLFSEKFDCVIWISLLRLSGKNLSKSVEETISEYVVQDILEKPELLQSVQEMLTTRQVLLVLDGFDEATDIVKAFIKPLLESEKFHLLLTARPETKGLPNWSRVQNMGFSLKHIKKYIDLFFEGDKSGFFNKIKGNSALFEIAKIPFHLQMLCHLEKGNANIYSQTELYQRMLSEILKWESERRKHKVEELISSAKKMGTYEAIGFMFKERRKLKPVANELFLLLGRAATLALIEKRPLSDRHFNEVLKKSPFTLQDCMETGLLKGFEFIHSSIGEYLIAHHLCTNDELNNFLLENDINLISHLFRFIVGILHQKNPESSAKFFLNEIKITKDNLYFVLGCLNECEGFFGDIPDLEAILSDQINDFDETIGYLMQNRYNHSIRWLDRKFPGIIESLGENSTSPILFVACFCGNIEFVEWIDKKYPSLLQKSYQQQTTPFDGAAVNGQIETLKWLSKKNPSFLRQDFHEQSTPFGWAAFQGQIEAMEWLFSKNPSLLQHYGQYGQTPMHGAARAGQIEAMQWLYDKETSLIHLVDLDGQTPMHDAAETGEIQAMEWLYEKDPSLLEKISEVGMTPLQYAAFGGQVEAMEWLYEKDPSFLEKTTEDGMGPLHYAAFGGHVRAVKWLKEKDPSLLEKISEKGMNSLHYAAFNGHVGVVLYLFDLMPSLLQTRTLEGQTPFALAQNNGHSGVVQSLIELEPSLLQETDQRGFSPLHWAVIHKNLEAMEWLFDKDSSLIQKVCNDGWSLLHSASIENHTESMNWLIEKDPTLLQKVGPFGMTVLHVAASEGHLDAVKLLVEKDPSLLSIKVEKSGRTALDIAKNENHELVVQYLKSKKTESEKCLIS